MSSAPLFLAYLAQFDDDGWLRVVDRLQGAMHPVDRVATRIWFHLYPLKLQRAFERSADPTALEKRLVLQGRWRLAEQIDASHTFLYGHRHWREVRDAIVAFASGPHVPGSLDLAAQIQEVAREVAAAKGLEPSLVVGITAIGVRTLQQVGLDALAASPGESTVPRAWGDLTPAQVLARRARDDGQGLFGFLRGERKVWTVTFDEREPGASFPLVHSQHVTTASGLDARDHRARDARLSEGAIPVHCRSASCGTCWVGVLGGAEKLSVVDGRERLVLTDCGYATSTEDRPVIRLACTAQAYGAVSIVIPPWNGRLKNLPHE